eukprot:336529_1
MSSFSMLLFLSLVATCKAINNMGAGLYAIAGEEYKNGNALDLYYIDSSTGKTTLVTKNKNIQNLQSDQALSCFDAKHNVLYTIVSIGHKEGDFYYGLLGYDLITGNEQPIIPLLHVYNDHITGAGFCCVGDTNTGNLIVFARKDSDLNEKVILQVTPPPPNMNLTNATTVILNEFKAGGGAVTPGYYTVFDSKRSMIWTISFYNNAYEYIYVSSINGTVVNRMSPFDFPGNFAFVYDTISDKMVGMQCEDFNEDGSQNYQFLNTDPVSMNISFTGQQIDGYCLYETGDTGIDIKNQIVYQWVFKVSKESGLSCYDAYEHNQEAFVSYVIGFDIKTGTVKSSVMVDDGSDHSGPYDMIYFDPNTNNL